MLDIGFAPNNAILSRRRLLPNLARLPDLGLSGLGTVDVTQGFTALPAVTGYSATPGRFRRTPTGFVRCAADEERLCFDSEGRFTGQALEGPEKYYSAAWDDPAAGHSSSDFAYLSGSASQVAYAGGHDEPDIFGGTGGGLVLTASAQNQLHNTSALRASGVAAGDIIRYEAIVAISNANADGRIELRGSGNPSFAFAFAHNAAGEVTGTITANGPGQPYQAEHRDLGILNGKRWYHLIVWRKAVGTAHAAMGIGFGNVPADAGKTFHLCDLRLVHNPQVAPGSWPVCAPNKSFAADTITTDVTATFGALFHGGAGRCRTRIEDGQLALAPDALRSHDGFSMVTRIELIGSSETDDRVGLMPYAGMERELAFWDGGAKSILLGPARFAVDVKHTATSSSKYSSLTIANAFERDPMLRGWFDGRLVFGPTVLTGDLTLDDTIVFPTCSTLGDQFEQVDLAALHAIDTAGRSISARRALFMSHPSVKSRARHQVQADDDLISRQVYMGQLLVTNRNVSTFSLDLSDSSFQNIGRALSTGTAGAVPGAIPMTVTADRVFYFQNWSDSHYLGHGDYTGSRFDNQFHGGFTSSATTLYHTRREIEVDIGNGWQPLSTTSLAENDLPVGRLARHAGTYDFDTDTLDSGNADAARTTIVRSWNIGSTPGGYHDKPGYQFHAANIDEGSYTRHLTPGETFVIEALDPPGPATPHVRFIADWGRWSTSTSFMNQGVAPALGGTGTHPDAWQTITYQITLDEVSSDGMVVIGDIQGPFVQGNGADSKAAFGAIDFTHFVGLIATTNAFVVTRGDPATATNVSLTDSLILPAYTPNRGITGNAGALASIRAAWAPTSIALDNVWHGTASGSSPVGEDGGVVTGSTDWVAMSSLSAFDAWTPESGEGTPGRDFIPPAFCDDASGYADSLAIANPVESGFAFTARAREATGIDLDDVLAKSLATGIAMKPLTDWLKPWQRDQDFIGVVPNNTPVGTKIDLREYHRFRPEDALPVGTLSGKAFEPRYGNPRPGLFDFDEDGDLAVVGSLQGIDRLFLFKTDAEELVLIDVR